MLGYFETNSQVVAFENNEQENTRRKQKILRLEN